jgi:hypothetical protein
VILPGLSHRIPGGQLERPLIDLQVPRDGPLGVFVPTTLAHFAALDEAPPDYLWLGQDVSGNLAPTIGVTTLTQNAAGTGYLYQQTVSGWTRKFVGLADVSQAGFYANLSFALGESFAVVIYAAVARPASGGSWGFVIAPQRGLLYLSSAGLLTHRNTAVAPATSAFAAPHGDVGTPVTVRPWIFYRNAATDQSGALTNLGLVTTVHDESALSGNLNLIGGLGGGSAPMRFCWGAIYRGANAERDWPAYLSKRGWAIPY